MLLDSSDCIQHVFGPTNKHGHNLGLVLSHGLDIKDTKMAYVAGLIRGLLPSIVLLTNCILLPTEAPWRQSRLTVHQDM
jgi:hypothetical protein